MSAHNDDELNTDLENMESFKLDIFTLILEQVHHHLQVILVCDVACHDFEIGPI